MNKIIAYLIDRFSEASTWRGVAAILTAFGVGLSPEQMETIIPVGLAITGLIGVATKG